jgi:hypothetical protein
LAAGALYIFDGLAASTPEIAIREGSAPGGPERFDGPGNAFDFGITDTGTPLLAEFTITNEGFGALRIGIISAPPGFSILNPPSTPLPPHGAHTFQARLDAAASSTFSGTIVIENDDSDEGHFEIDVAGLAAPAAYLNWGSAAGLSGPSFDPLAQPFADGVESLLKFAFNMDGSGRDQSVLVPGTGTSGLPDFSITGSGATRSFRVEFVRRTGGGVNYRALRSNSLAPGSWTPFPGLPTITPIDPNWERVSCEAPFDPAVTPSQFGSVEVTLR